jgi:hypothetical protein
MTRLALAVFTAALISTSALAQTTNQSGPLLPSNPNGSSSNSADENGVSPTGTPGAGPNGTVMDSTKSGDDGAYARQNSTPPGQPGTTGQGNNGGATNGPLPERRPTER